jgi:spore maturation protein A
VIILVLSYIITGIFFISFLFAALLGRGSALSAAIAQGAQSGITVAISIAGSICLWSGVGALMESIGITALLSRWLGPGLKRLFPSTRQDKALSSSLSANICANLLGLGNAATPMGIRAAQLLAGSGGQATDELCRLIVLNTASIQLIPANVAALRASLGAPAPFDILPAVWITSLCSAGLGLAAAWLLGKLWRHD